MVDKIKTDGASAASEAPAPAAPPADDPKAAAKTASKKEGEPGGSGNISQTPLYLIHTYFLREDKVEEYNDVTGGLFGKWFQRKQFPEHLVMRNTDQVPVWKNAPGDHIKTDRGEYDLLPYALDPRATPKELEEMYAKLRPVLEDKTHPGITPEQLSQEISQRMGAVDSKYAPKDIDASKFDYMLKTASGTFEGGGLKPPYVGGLELGPSDLLLHAELSGALTDNTELHEKLKNVAELPAAFKWGSARTLWDYAPPNWIVGAGYHGIEIYNGKGDKSFWSALIDGDNWHFDDIRGTRAISAVAKAATGVDPINNDFLIVPTTMVAGAYGFYVYQQTGRAGLALYNTATFQFLDAPWQWTWLQGVAGRSKLAAGVRYVVGGTGHALSAPGRFVLHPVLQTRAAVQAVRSVPGKIGTWVAKAGEAQAAGAATHAAGQTAANLVQAAEQVATRLADEAMKTLEKTVGEIITANPDATAVELRRLINEAVTSATDAATSAAERLSGTNLPNNVADRAVVIATERINQLSNVTQAFTNIAARVTAAAEQIVSQLWANGTSFAGQMNQLFSTFAGSQEGFKQAVEQCVEKAVEVAGRTGGTVLEEGVVKEAGEILLKKTLASSQFTQTLARLAAVAAPVVAAVVATTPKAGAAVAATAKGVGVAAKAAGVVVSGVDGVGGAARSHERNQVLESMHGNSYDNAMVFAEAAEDQARDGDLEGAKKSIRRARQVQNAGRQQVQLGLANILETYGHNISAGLVDRGLNFFGIEPEEVRMTRVLTGMAAIDGEKMTEPQYHAAIKKLLSDNGFDEGKFEAARLQATNPDDSLLWRMVDVTMGGALEGALAACLRQQHRDRVVVVAEKYVYKKDTPEERQKQHPKGTGPIS